MNPNSPIRVNTGSVPIISPWFISRVVYAHCIGAQKVQTTNFNLIFASLADKISPL
jgi:hypothetical protein